MEETARIDRARGHSGGSRGVVQNGWRGPFLAGSLLVVAVAVAIAGGLAVFQLVHAQEVFPGVKVGQIEVGGMTREKALAALRPVYEERSSRSVMLRLVGMERRASAADLGAVLDPAVAADAAFKVGRVGGWGERLAAQLGALIKGYSIEAPGVALDRKKMDGYLDRLGKEINRPVKDAELVIGDDLSVRVNPSVVGRQLDAAGASTAIEKAIVDGASSADLPVVETQPKRVERDLEDARGRVAKMLSGPAALEFEGKRWTLSPKEIASLVSVEIKEGVAAPIVSIKDDSLKKLVDKIGGEVDQPKVNARYDWNGGNLKLLQAGQDGRKLDRARALTLLTGAMSGDQRTAALPVEVEKAAGGSLDPSQLGIKERIEFGTTTLAGVPEKIHNIKLAASRLNGVLVGPGEIFSFNKELGPTTLKSGFQIGFGIAVNNGEMQTVPSVAGGICQVATTLLHAVFRAGYQIEERYPHLYWIPGYGLPPSGMVGLDATVDDPTLDLQFMNNTENYLLIQSKTEGNTLEFDLYGTKPTWKVDIEGPIITNVVKADQKTIRQEEPTWEVGRELWVERATDGMDVDLIRRVTQGSDVRTLHLKSRYQPSGNVLMVGTKKPSAPSPQATAAAAAANAPADQSTTPAATATPTAPGAAGTRTP